jgi:hypothetical protein
VCSCTSTRRKEPMQLQCSLSTGSTSMSGDGIRTRYFYICSRPGGESSMSHCWSHCNHEPLKCLRGLRSCSRHLSKCPRRSCPTTYQSLRYPHLLLQSNRGHHDPRNYHIYSNEPSWSQYSPSRSSPALPDCTIKDSHAFLRHPPVPCTYTN